MNLKTALEYYDSIAVFWYNYSMKNYSNINNYTNEDYTVFQEILPLNCSVVLPKDHKLYSFMELMKGVDFNKYIKKRTDPRGRKGYDKKRLFLVLLYAFYDKGGKASYSEIEQACVDCIPYRILMNEETPDRYTFCRFVNDYLVDEIDQIFFDIVGQLTAKMPITRETQYIDGTKFEANANKYTGVYKKRIMTNMGKMFDKMNEGCMKELQKRFHFYAIKETYCAQEIGYICQYLMEQMCELGIEFVYGRGHKKSELQKLYDTFVKCYQRQLEYEMWLYIIGERNNCSKTDHDATFCALKVDFYCKTGLSRPAYNAQIAISDGVIVNAELYPNPGDTLTFPLFIERYHQFTGQYPENPMADAGYGSVKNYLYCLTHKMNLVMKYGLYARKNTAKFKKKKFNPANWQYNSDGFKVCPNGNVFDVYLRDSHNNDYNIRQLYTNKERCKGCPFRKECLCTKKKPVPDDKAYKTISLNVVREQLEQEVDKNLGTNFGKELKKQRSIQVEGAFGVIKQDMGFTRFKRRGKKKTHFEFLMICIAYNLRKYHRYWLEQQKKETIDSLVLLN